MYVGYIPGTRGVRDKNFNAHRVGITLLGFILYCLLARWYKRRVRDEADYKAQVSFYDRY